MKKNTEGGSKSVSAEELRRILDQHQLWLDSGGEEGKQAGLSGLSMRGANLSGVNLSVAVLSGIDLTEADLTEANLSGANLEKANLSRARLEKANLRGACLHGAELNEAYLRAARLGDSDLSGAKVSESAVLCGTSFASDLSRTSRKLFVSMLAACLMCWFPLAATSDIQLIMNDGTVRLPLIGMDISVRGFYVAAPVLLLVIYIYFLAYIRRLWEAIMQLPAIFPDGACRGEKLPPFILTGMGTWRLYSVLLLFISDFLALVPVPLTIIFFWLRYLTRHELLVTIGHIVVATVSIWVGFIGFRTFTRGNGEEFTDSLETDLEKIGRWTQERSESGVPVSVALVFYTVVILLVISAGAIRGRPVCYPSGVRSAGDGSKSGSRAILQGASPVVLGLVGVNPFADLRDGDISKRPTGPGLVGEDELELVKGARLRGRDLRYADAGGAFLVNANLLECNLSYARLDGADLRFATLGTLQRKWWWVPVGTPYFFGDLDELPRLEQNGYIDLLASEVSAYRVDFRRFLNGAKLKYAFLRGARVDDAILRGVNLEGANLAFATLRGTDMRLANLRNAHLFGSDVTEALLRKADLRGANLSYVTGLTQQQVDSAITDANTLLPSTLYRETYGEAYGSETGISDSALDGALESGWSVIVGRIEGADWIRDPLRSRTRAFSYRARVLKCIIGGDLKSSDIEGRDLALYAGSFRPSQAAGKTYIMFIGKHVLLGFRYVWHHSNAVIDVSGPDGTATIDSFATKAKAVYKKTDICKFREEKIDPNTTLPELPAGLGQACSQFKARAENRCKFAKQIVESEIGSGLGQSRRFPGCCYASLAPKLRLTKSQVILLLGEPAVKYRWSYLYPCGKDAEAERDKRPYGLNGLLTVNFDESLTVDYAGYARLPGASVWAQP